MALHKTDILSVFQNMWGFKQEKKSNVNFILFISYRITINEI
jgi:hypothetical protein